MQQRAFTLMRSPPPATPTGALSSSQPRPGCHSLATFRCDACDRLEERNVSCRQPCSACPWRDRSPVSATLDVIPRVPVRHWVFRPAPEQQRRLLDGLLLRRASRIFVTEIFRLLESTLPRVTRRAVACGGVSVVHHSNAALELDPHLHALVLDGGYSDCDGDVVFTPMTEPPGSAALAELGARVRQRLGRLFANTPDPGPPRVEQRVVTGPIARRCPRAIRGPAPPHNPRNVSGTTAKLDGMRIFAAKTIGPHERSALSRIARYLLRPIPDPRLFSRTPDGMFRYRLHRPFADGTTHVEFDPEALTERLAALGSAPRHRVALHGVLASSASKRWPIKPGQLSLFPLPPRAPPTSIPSTRIRSRPSKTPSPRIPAMCRSCGAPMQLVTIQAGHPRGPP